MKKKVIIGVCCGVVVVAIIVAIVVVMIKKNNDDSGSSKKSDNSTNTSTSNTTEKESKSSKGSAALEAMAEDFADALKSEKDMEKFVDKNIDFKLYAAIDSIDDPTAVADEKAFKKIVEDADEEDADEMKEELLETLNIYVDEDNEYSYKSLGKEKDFPMLALLKCYTAKYEDEEGEETGFVFITYEDSLVFVVSEEEMTLLEGYMSMADQMGSQESNLYNAQFTSYIGDGLKGSEIKSLLDSIIISNETNVDEQGKFIGVYVDEINNYDEADELEEACDNASDDNSEDNVKEASDKIKTLKSKINSTKSYSTEAEYDDNGVIVSVTIYED